MKIKVLAVIASVVLGAVGVKATVYHNETHKVTHFDYSGYTFTYEENGETKTANLTDEARTPDHMIALLKEVYTNPEIPGIHYAYDSLGLTQSRKIDYNSFGHKGTPWKDDKSVKYPTPYGDGMTLLLVQCKNDFSVNDLKKTKDPKEYMAKAYESIKLMPNFTRVNDPVNPGYLFTIDGVANRFFFISKGKPRSAWTRPLYRLFEQISPVNAHDGEQETTSFIENMRAGESFYCYHDCTDVCTVSENNKGHWFTISDEGESYSLKNLALFIPDRRFEYELTDKADDYNSKEYFNEYGNTQDPDPANWDHNMMPRTLMYRVDLTTTLTPPEIDEDDDDDYFTITLDWTSSFMGMDVPEHFWVYQVEGNTRTELDLLQPQPVTCNTFSFKVKREIDPQQFKFVVVGAPMNLEEDGSLILDSNDNPLVTISAESRVCTVNIPGLDPFFSQVSQYRSRYDYEQQINIYKNEVTVAPSTPKDYLAIKNNQDPFFLTRTDDEGNKVQIATVKFTEKESGEGYDYEVTYNNDSQVTNIKFDNSEPITTGSFNSFADAQVKVLDRFTASTENNEQSGHYTYLLEQTADKFSNPLIIPVYKTDENVQHMACTREEVEADVDHSMFGKPDNLVTFNVFKDPLGDLMQYDLYAIDENNNTLKRVAKVEKFDNYGNYYVFNYVNEGANATSGEVSNIQVDESGAGVAIRDVTASTKTKRNYVPVITTRCGGDPNLENTYGCDLKGLDYPKVAITVWGKVKSASSFGSNTDRYMGYGTNLTITPTLTDDAQYAYYYRVWRLPSEGSTYEEEVLLNDEQSIETADWEKDYDQIKDFYPGNDRIRIRDVFVDRETETGKTRTVKYVVRLYATNISEDDMPAHSMLRGTDGRDFLVSEETVNVYFNDDTPTGLEQLAISNDVAGVTYYNIMGVASEKPFDGVNIVVTRYKNGRTSTKKEVKF
ncbi:MAG: hypothetical protein IK092_02850 [Muribaculaceae bacterium]|nr:hypothetical protein [Muribaculaceae bacterium]